MDQRLERLRLLAPCKVPGCVCCGYGSCFVRNGCSQSQNHFFRIGGVGSNRQLRQRVHCLTITVKSSFAAVAAAMSKSNSTLMVVPSVEVTAGYKSRFGRSTVQIENGTDVCILEQSCFVPSTCISSLIFFL
jgi:hypothetical protein